MDWYPLFNSLRIAAISAVAVFFAGIAAAYYIAKLPRLVNGVLPKLCVFRGAPNFAACCLTACMEYATLYIAIQNT